MQSPILLGALKR